MKRFMRINYSLKLIILILSSTLFSMVISKFGIGKESILMVYLVGVLIVTVVTRGYMYGAIASIISVLLFNYLFTMPIHTFLIYNPNDITLLLFFFISSLISSSLTSRFQKQLLIAQKKQQTACLLYEITESFLNITGKKNIIMQGINYIHEHTGYTSKVTLFEDNEIYAFANINVDLSHMSSVNMEIKGVDRGLGNIRIFYEEEEISLDNELLIKMVITQIGVSLEREFIYKEREKIKIQMEKEHLKNNLLRGISHDLRTPLTAIVGASDVVIENINNLDLMSIKKMVTDINEEALWLNNIVENILNMTRIDEGKLVIQKQDEVVDDVINQSLSHVSGAIKDRKIEVEFPEEVISAPMDGKLIVQVVINLLDNAIKYTKENDEIKIKIFTENDFVIFEIEDTGCGINPKIINNIFESFVTSSGKVIDGKRGIGIGLSICKAIINAHGGEIYAKNKKDNGAIFRFTLPLMEG